MTRFPQLLLLVCFTTVLGFSKRPSIELQGKVVNVESGVPIANVYLFTVEGEEEAITDKNGDFRFTTWRRFPFVLTVKHGDYQKQQLQITRDIKQLHIKIKRTAE